MTTITETNKPDEKQNENRKPRPAYYAVIPADVRYDSKLPQGAKLLYGEITALCNRKGFCWARNAYFAKLYQKDERTVNRWIKALKDGGYITVSFTFAPGSKEVDDRIICLTKPKAEPPGDNGEDAPSGPGSPPPDGRNDGPPEGHGSREVVTFLSGGGDTGVTAYGQNDQPDPPGPPEDSGENASFRPLNPQNPPENGYNGPPERHGGQEAAAFLPGGGDTGVTTPGHFCQGVVTFLSGGGDKNVQDNSTSTNIIKATAAAKNTPEEKTRTEAAAAPNIKKLKDALAAVSRELVFDGSFYPKALAFMAENRLDDKYLPWLHAQCLAKKPRFLPGLFYSLFFADNMLESFKVSRSPPPAPPVVIIVCPACGASHDQNKDCPACGLKQSDPPEQADLLKRLYALPEEKRAGYFAREEAILSENGLKDFKQTNARLQALREEFNVIVKEDSS